MSQEKQSQSEEHPGEEEEEEHVKTKLEQFQDLCDKYYSIVNESSLEFQQEKFTIEQSFQNELSFIDNYWKAKLAHIRQEGKFIQQLEDNKNQSC